MSFLYLIRYGRERKRRFSSKMFVLVIKMYYNNVIIGPLRAQGTRVEYRPKPGTKNKMASIYPALTRSFLSYFLFGSFHKVIYDMLTFVSPFMQR